jgi:RNA polymerase sigma factor (sigma-70 family)
MSGTANDPVGPISWHSLIERIRGGDSAACEELYSAAFQDVRRRLQRFGDPHANDRTHDAYLATIQAIVNGEPHDPAALPGFIHAIARRMVCASLRERYKQRLREVVAQHLPLSDSKLDLEEEIFIRQKREWLRKALADLPSDQRDILERFYVLEQRPEQICEEMKLTETQYRLLKWRSKRRFAELANKQRRSQSLARLASGGTRLP